MSGLLARKAERDGNGVAAGAEQAVASAAGSSGSALPDTLMRKFESSLGADLSSVRVHTGGASEDAAHAVGAKAYTMGQDIHFGAGHYDPHSDAGQHLLAHEVAHTVQQGGSTPHRQNKLEVSTPFDAAEHEADHAAAAMVSGRPFAVTTGAGVQRKVFRDSTPAPADKGKLTDADKAQARRVEASIGAVRAALLTARKSIDADAKAAATSISQTRQLYKDFERTYRSAVAKFTAGVAEARAAQDMFDKGISFAADTALKATGAIGGVAKEAVDMYGNLRKAQSALAVVEGMLVTPTSAVAPPMPGAGEGKGDWEGLLNTLHTTFSQYTELNGSFTKLDAKCTEAEWVQNVANGTLDPVPKDLWTAGPGKTAAQFGSQSGPMIAQLGTLKTGMLSAKPAEFLAKVQASLPSQTIAMLEKAVAMRWVASLQGADTGAINSARKYLAKLGVIDGNGNELGVTMGLGGSTFGMSAFAQKLTAARAKVDQRAKELVGTAVYWSDKGGGTINDPETGSRYQARGQLDPAGNKDSQRVQITGYTVSRGNQAVMAEMADQGKGDPMGQVQGEVLFTFVPYKSS
ncbi:MAG: DUF4157 domain-containing protein [Kofleriaceae bacterium]